MGKVHSNLAILEQTLERAKDGFLTGAEYTLADIQLVEEINNILFFYPQILEKHERVAKWCETLNAIPKMQELQEKYKEEVKKLKAQNEASSQ